MKKLTQAQKIDAIYDIIMKRQGSMINQNYEPHAQKPKYPIIGGIEVYPHDLPTTMTYNDAVKAVEKLGDGWRIPTLEELREIYKNKDASFCTTSSGSDYLGYPDWYWSSTENRNNPSYVPNVRFSDGYEFWNRKDGVRLSCRPVR